MTPKQYSSFISYSHSDEAFAARLHRFLERWKTPRKLAGRPNRDGVVPGHLNPVFRDRNELPTAADLGAVIRTALKNSKYLIVLCSPRAAASQWVNQEVLDFKAIHGEGRVIAAILDGEPPHCFPEALRFVVDDCGVLTNQPTEPVAADFRNGKDGQQAGRLKLVAGLLGVNFDDLYLRAKRRHALRISVGVGAVGLAAVLLTWVTASGIDWLLAYQERGEAEYGLSKLSQGRVFEGAADFLRADTFRESWGTPAHDEFEKSLRRRLIPFEEAAREIPVGELRTWRDRTLLRAAERLIEVPEAHISARVGRKVLLAKMGAGLTVVDGATGDLLQETTLNPNESICAIWSSSDDTGVAIEGYRIGLAGARSYGFRLTYDPELERFGEVRRDLVIGRDVCTSESELGGGGGFGQIGVPVAEFAWPRLRFEETLWFQSELAAPDRAEAPSGLGAMAVISPDGAHAAALQGTQSVLILEVDGSRRDLVHKVEFSQPVRDIAFAGSDRLMVLRHDARIISIDPKTGEDSASSFALGSGSDLLNVPAETDRRMLRIASTAQGDYFAVFVARNPAQSETRASWWDGRPLPALYATIFETTMMRRIGGPVPLPFTLDLSSKDPMERAWLDRSRDGALVIGIEPYGALIERDSPIANDWGPDLTGITIDGRSDELPESNLSE